MSDALESEQRNVTAFYELLDSYTAHVIERIDKTASAPSTGTGQDTVERQAELDHWSTQLRSARAAADRLAFGRVDLDVDGRTEIRHIGRMGLRDAEGNPVLLDWRAPTAAGFYQATALQPMGVELRRRIITRGRTVTHIDDEDLQDPVHDVTDAAAASVETPREGRMGDIVATIAADQDSIVRSTTMKVLLGRMRSLGLAREIHVRIACPPIVAPCFYGIDMSTIDELFAPPFMRDGLLTEEAQAAMAAKLGADSLRYLPVESVARSIGFDASELCQACLTGQYPTPAGERLYQLAIGHTAGGEACRTYETAGR
jgi:hypothetical protein